MITHHRVVGSTSDLAAEAARQGAPEGVAFRGDIQQQGRGRHGRNWVSPEGNLYLSVLLRPARPMAEWPSLSLVASVALADAISRLRGPGRASLKWPNDILLDGRKCAGLLLEIVDDAVILGCGVNCLNAPDGVDGWQPGSLNQDPADPPLTPDDLLEALEICLVARYNEWQFHGFERLREDWIAAAAHIGKVISVDQGDELIEGVFETLKGDGSLCLRNQAGEIIVIQAGDVRRARPKGEDYAAGD